MKEIERKFLIKDILSIPKYVRKSEITQAYISVLPEVRIRKLNDTYYRTEKSEGGIIREEREEEISEEEFYKLLPASIGIVIHKERFYIELSHYLIAEVDIYASPFYPLATVEVEFPSLKQAMSFDVPEWFGREVTKDKAYKNKSLALYGLPEGHTDK